MKLEFQNFEPEFVDTLTTPNAVAAEIAKPARRRAALSLYTSRGGEQLFHSWRP